MLDFLKIFKIGKSTTDNIYIDNNDEDKYRSPDEQKLKDKLNYDDLRTFDDNEIEAQHINGTYVSNQDYAIPDPLTIRQKILHYRWMAENFYIDDAIEKIVNEAIIQENNKIVALDLSDVDLTDNIKSKLHDEWNNTLRIIQFNKYAYSRFESFYRDGRANYRMIFSDKIQDGVIGIQELDSLHVEKFSDKKNNKILYQYKDMEDRPFVITENAMISLNSGKTNKHRNMYISYLNQAIKPLNLLIMMVDAMTIYRITRAPERRVFNISTGRRTPKKAKAYINDVIANLKTNLSFNSSTGKMSQSYKVLTMVEDFYFPKSEGDAGTTVEPLAGGTQLGEITDIQFLERNLLKSLKIPLSRSDSDSKMDSIFGNNTSDINKEENDFSKFINKLRNRYKDLILIPYRLNLILKKIITPDEWDAIEDDLSLIWSSDSHIAELKFNEKYQTRANTVDSLETYIGIDYSRKWIRKNIWKFTDAEVEEMQKQIEQEKTAEGSDDENTDEQN